MIDPAVSVPRYGEASLADLMPSVLAALGVPDERNVLGLSHAPRICVLLVDGLGLEQLRGARDTAPFLSSLGEGAVLTAGFPATTAASLGSLGTGLPPGRHGLVGYLVAIPGEGRLMNSLRWDDGVDPVVWQPRPTIFERATVGGVTASHVAARAFERSGLTGAAMRGGRHVPADSAGELVAGAAAGLRAADHALAYVYYADLDATGHRAGCRSDAWRYQLAHVDRLVEQLASALPSDAVLYITGDHGMVDVPPERRVDADNTPGLRDGVALLGGEARARHVYSRPGAAASVLDAWRELLGDSMWVVARDEAVAREWFGPEVPADVLPRIGDVIGAAKDDAAIDGPSAPTLLDVRWRLGGPPGFDDYLAGHLPGAVFCDLDRDLAAPPGAAGRHPLPDPAAFQQAMRRLGVRSDRAVVVYDQGDAVAAARAWWTLRYFGHDEVRVLDGGYDAWRAAGLPVTVGGPSVERGDFVARPGGMPILDAEGAGALARDGVLLDARAPARYRGEDEPMDPVAGHIPGAVNAPSAANLGEDGRLLPPEVLRARFGALGADGRREVGAYCGSGVSAAHEVLALTLAGVPAALYVGSWSHWVSDPSRPVATGEEP